MLDAECKQYKNIDYKTKKNYEITYSYEKYSNLFIFLSKISNIGFKHTTDKSYVYYTLLFLILQTALLKRASSPAVTFQK